MNTIRADSAGKLPAVLDNIAKQGNPLVGVMKDGSLCVTIKKNFAGGGGGGGAPSGPAGGELAGIYPNPTLKNAAVTGKLLTALDTNRQIVISANDSLLQALSYVAYKLNSLSGLSVGPAGGELGGNYPNPTLQNSAVIAKLLTGLNTGLTGNLAATDSLLDALGKIAYQLGLINAALFKQLLVDPDFDTPGIPLWTANTNNGTLTRISDGLGGFMAKLEPDLGWASTIFQDPILLPNHSYHISGTMWSHGNSPGKLIVTQGGGGTTIWNGQAAEDVWQPFSVDYSADDVSGSGIYYGIDYPSATPNGYIYIDKLSVAPIII